MLLQNNVGKKMNKMISFLRLARQYMAFNLSAGMEYRTSFFIQVLGMALNNSAFIFFWLILFERIGGNINGYGFQQVMFLWALSAAGYGFADVFLGNSQHISRLIYSGELDVYLLQPKPVLPNLLASRMSISGWGDLAYGLLLFLFTQPLTVASLTLFLLFSLLMMMVLVSIRVIYHSLTFFFGNAESFAGTVSELMLSFMLYPGSIFKRPVTWILHSLIPAALVAYLPVEIIANGRYALFLILLPADVLVVGTAFAIFRLGLRKYESGSRIGTRL